MCGIVGYVGPQQAAPTLIEGLMRLEYRGYDSAGISVLGATGQTVVRRVGRVRELESALPKGRLGKVGIGHTRWATHGPATEANAHPHSSADGKVCVVHNGILDNAAELRASLTIEGCTFTSETDTEVLAHLVSRSDAKTLEDRVMEALEGVVGSYAIAVTHSDFPDRIVVARNGSPLLLGVGDKEMFIASDGVALVRHTSSVLHLEDGELASVTATGYRTFNRESDDTRRQPTQLDALAVNTELNGFAHYMAKEIAEQPETVARMVRGRLDERYATSRLDDLALTTRDLRAFKRVKILGCGSAYYVGEMGAILIEELSRVPAHAEAASEFRYRNPIIEPDALYVAVSQSGETADTAFAVREIKRKGGHVVALVNVVGSTIARECDGKIYLHAGSEIAVASTKALTNMAVGFALLALQLGRVRDLSVADGKRIIDGLQQLPEQIRTILRNEQQIAEVAREIAKVRSMFFVGRVRGFPVAREGAQKLKEVSYIHAEAYQTSELKHGPIALIEQDMPTVAVVPHDALTDRNLAAIEQIKARDGRVVALTHPTVDLDGLVAHRINVPISEPELTPILMTVPLQLLAYHTACALGLDVDKPRNLAKSVTVE